MNGYIVVLRFVHIVSGAFWFGSAAFMALLLQPAAAAEGPAGGQVMDRMIKLGMPAYFTVASVGAFGSGLLLYLRNFSSLVPPMESGAQLGFATGGLAGLLAFTTVFAMHVPNARKMATLQEELQGPPSPDQMARMQDILRKTKLAVRTTFVLLFITISMMAVARYL